MSQLSPGQARIIDPIQSERARGYTNSEYVGNLIFPRVFVKTYGGQVVEFDAANFKPAKTKRAPGSNVSKKQAGYAGKPYLLSSRAQDAVVPKELQLDAQNGPGIDLQSDTVDLVVDTMALEMELKQSTLVRTTANLQVGNYVTLSGASRWTQSTATITADIRTAREAIRRSIGRYPNTCIISPSAFNACDEQASIRDRLKYTSKDTLSEEMLAGLFNVSTLRIGAAVYDDDADARTDVWGDDVVLAYVPENVLKTPANRRSKAIASAGYTYTMEGHPSVGMFEWDRSVRSWVAPVDDDAEPVIAMKGAIYVIKNAGT